MGNPDGNGQSNSQPAPHFLDRKLSLFQTRVGGHAIEFYRLEHVVRLQGRNHLRIVSGVHIFDEGDAKMSIKKLESRFQSTNASFQLSNLLLFQRWHVRYSALICPLLALEKLDSADSLGLRGPQVSGSARLPHLRLLQLLCAKRRSQHLPQSRRKAVPLCWPGRALTVKPALHIRAGVSTEQRNIRCDPNSKPAVR